MADNFDLSSGKHDIKGTKGCFESTQPPPPATRPRFMACRETMRLRAAITLLMALMATLSSQCGASFPSPPAPPLQFHHRGNQLPATPVRHARAQPPFYYHPSPTPTGVDQPPPSPTHERRPPYDWSRSVFRPGHPRHPPYSFRFPPPTL
ncbi:unnamed protein product [Musa textilis]